MTANRSDHRLSDNEARASLFEALLRYDLPAAVYVVRKDASGSEHITDCNYEFAKMFHYDSMAEVVNTPPATMHRSAEEYEAFIRELYKANKISHYSEVLRTRTGELLLVEVHCRLDYDEDGKVIGRTGIVMDVSEFELLLKDIGQILHHFTSTMTGIQQRLYALREALIVDEDPFGPPLRVPEAEEVDSMLIAPAEELERALAKMVDEVSENPRGREAFSEETWDELEDNLTFLQVYRDHVEQVESRPPALRQVARSIIDVVRNVPKGYINRETLRNVSGKASELERMVCLLDLHLTSGRLVEMDHEVHALRELALYGMRSKERKVDVPVTELITETVRNMQEFAFSRDIDIKVEDRSRKALVVINKRDTMRAVQNLLHNAIKYSWSKGVGRPWITIRSFIEGPLIVLEIENYGVPIPRYELEQELIYDLGYRGSMSGDRSRLGTGIGLYDARRVARSHGGDVVVSSRPASTSADPDDLSKPFITIARMVLPTKVKGL